MENISDFEIWKEAFSRVGVDIEQFKKEELLYTNDNGEYPVEYHYTEDPWDTDKLKTGGFYGWQFEMILNEDHSIKKLKLESNY